MLDIETPAQYSDVITGWEYHSHKPYASSTFNNNDEIRIPISQQDIITAPFESFLHINGTVSGKKADGTTEATVALVNNAIAYLFSDIRYELSGIEIDRTKNVGITSSLKNILSIREEDKNNLKNACWFGPGNKENVKEFSYSVPLKMYLGVFEDYPRIIVNQKQELILLRSATDNDAIISDDAATIALRITNLSWRVPHVTVSDLQRLKLLRMIEKDFTVHVPFRSWELHEYPTLPNTTLQIWQIKTSSQLETPRQAIVAFQKGKKNNMKKDMSTFDDCKIVNIRLHLNSQYHPYENIHGDMSIFYEMFARFQNSYFAANNRSPAFDLETFKAKTLLYVIDCSRQNDTIKSGPVDVRLELETKEPFPANTSAYCLLLHDSHITYSMLTGTVKRLT